MPGSLFAGWRATIDAMAHVLLLILGALVVGAIAYGVTWIVTGNDRGLDPEEPDGRAVPLPSTRPLTETDIETIRFDTTLRGYRMDQVDAALRRAAYDLGYKEELIEVLEAEILAVREGRDEEAEVLRVAREGSSPTGRPAVVSDLRLEPGATGRAADELDADATGVQAHEQAHDQDDDQDDELTGDARARASSGR